MARTKKLIDCDPPHDCFNCPYPDDCHSGKRRTKAESEFIGVAELARNGQEKGFPLAKDYVHNRCRRLV